MLKRPFYYLVTSLLICSCVDSTTDTKDGANDLINETSPYLLQHAYNPVDWKGWNNESLELAKKENKLIVISVAYSACHWCHVMEEESFEDDSIAKLMNDNFVSIKVDREERPDVDQIYMNAVQLMTGSGGWPLNCIALPDGRPVFGGTYFTKKQWAKVLSDMSDLYKTNPEKVIAYGERLTAGVRNSDLITLNNSATNFTKNALDQYVKNWKTELDTDYGGKIGAPKFPLPNNLEVLLRYSFQNDDVILKQYVTNSLNKMANGGIYDQIGGGFSRYAVDETWHIPHFEKMLYDNAQLVSVYAKAYKLTKNADYKNVVVETLQWIERELLTNNSAFYSSIDADSKTEEQQLEEGVFYTWTIDELQQILNDDFTLFSSYYNINPKMTWENNSYVLFKTSSQKDFVKTQNLNDLEFQQKLKRWKKLLLAVRNKRDKPKTDDKVLTSWNALMLNGYIEAYRALGNTDYLAKALNNANFLKNNLLTSDGGLYRNYKNGKATISGFAEDYAHVISAFIKLYEVTFDEDWLNLANELMDYTITHFLDKENSMFYYTSNNDTNLIARKTEVIDNVIPSSNSVMAKNLFALSHYYSNGMYKKLAIQMMNNMKPNIEKSPSSFSNWLDLYLNYTKPYYEVAISGAKAKDKIEEINAQYLPNILIAGAIEESNLPIMKNRFNPEDTYIYVCVDGTCKLPVISTDQAISQLKK